MNSFGQKYRISLFGASHTPVLGVEIEGCPAGICLDELLFEPDLSRRRGGAPGTTRRVERDIPHIEHGFKGGVTTGETIRIVFENREIKPDDYKPFLTHPRPSHADWVAQQKYGNSTTQLYGNTVEEHHYHPPTGGGIFSGRLTLPLTAAGVVAKRLLQKRHPNLHIEAKLIEVGGCGIKMDAWEKAIVEAQEAGDSLGGVIECCATGVPVGWGEPFFNSIESCISHLAFSIPGIKGIEFGSGFDAANMYGSEHNDCYIDAQGHTATNHAGGINGGISNGNPLIFRVAVKPTPSISRPQESFDFALRRMATLSIQGRHDVCFALRLPVVVEAITAIVLADYLLINQSKTK